MKLLPCHVWLTLNDSHIPTQDWVSMGWFIGFLSFVFATQWGPSAQYFCASPQTSCRVMQDVIKHITHVRIKSKPIHQSSEAYRLYLRLAYLRSQLYACRASAYLLAVGECMKAEDRVFIPYKVKLKALASSENTTSDKVGPYSKARPPSYISPQTHRLQDTWGPVKNWGGTLTFVLNPSSSEGFFNVST